MPLYSSLFLRTQLPLLLRSLTHKPHSWSLLNFFANFREQWYYTFTSPLPSSQGSTCLTLYHALPVVKPRCYSNGAFFTSHSVTLARLAHRHREMTKAYLHFASYLFSPTNEKARIVKRYFLHWTTLDLKIRIENEINEVVFSILLCEV